MSLLFGNDRDPVRERHRLEKIFELEDLLQTIDSIYLPDLPANDMQHKVIDLGGSERRNTAATRDALSCRKIDHFNASTSLDKSAGEDSSTRSVRLPAATNAS